MTYMMFIAIAIAALFVYLPGYLGLRAANADRATSLAAAPLVSLPFYFILPILYEALAIPSGWANVFIPTLAIFAMAFVVTRGKRAAGPGVKRGKRATGPNAERARRTAHPEATHANRPTRPGTARPKRAARPDAGHASWLIGISNSPSRWHSRGFLAAVYVIVGLLATVYVFVRPLADPDAAIQTFDNVYHLNLISTFAKTGLWSSLSAGLYADLPASVLAPTSPAFYPAAWHTIGAMLVSCLGISSQMAQNALIALTSGVIFPLCMFLFMGQVFQDSPRAVAFGSIASVSIAAFPWLLLFQWPLPPNALGMTLAISYCACFMSLFDRRPLSERMRIAALLLVGAIAIAFVHPNSVFTIAALLMAFLIAQAARGFGLQKLEGLCERRPAAKYAAMTATALIIAVIWTACYFAPPLQGVVQYQWDPYTTVPDAIKRTITFLFREGSPQYALTIAFACGVLSAILRRKHLWLVGLWGLMSGIFIADSATSGFLQHFLSGFWYTDSYRTAGQAAIASMPLVALGFCEISTYIQRAFSYVARRREESKESEGREGKRSRLPERRKQLPEQRSRLPERQNQLPEQRSRIQERQTSLPGMTPVAAILACLVTIALFVPAAYHGGFPQMRATLKNRTETPTLYTLEEQDFVRRAAREITPGALILNDPFDGSALAYSYDDLPIYYRYFMGYGGKAEPVESIIARTESDEIAVSADVREALIALEADYILLLDKNNYDVPDRIAMQDQLMWDGLETTEAVEPYLSEIMSEGDMVLLKINREALEADL